MAWLLRQGEVLASVDLAESLGAKTRAVLGSAPGGGGAVLVSVRLAHTLGAPFAFDVAFLDADRVVVATVRVARNRVALPRRGSHSVLAAEAGAFDRWGLCPGDRLEIKD